MSKITNDGLTRSGTGCSIAVHIWQQSASKGKVIQRQISASNKLYRHTNEYVAH